MSESRSFANVGINSTESFSDSCLLTAEFLREPPSDLCNFERMGQPIMKDLGLVRSDDLGNFGKPMQRRCIEYAITIKLEIVPCVF